MPDVIKDFIMKVSSDASQQWTDKVGCFSLGEMADRSLRLLEFAQSHRLTNLHQYSYKRLWLLTWHFPDDLSHNQIDFITTKILQIRHQQGIDEGIAKSIIILS